ncbi:hypothetical protein LX36DRAFT_364248 [Colletotrichum falcatum]|nr:hypothetical protein LX36DRAFT_364248 [Colletotrichum falcatum]
MGQSCRQTRIHGGTRVGGLMLLYATQWGVASIQTKMWTRENSRMLRGRRRHSIRKVLVSISVTYGPRPSDPAQTATQEPFCVGRFRDGTKDLSPSLV